MLLVFWGGYCHQSAGVWTKASEVLVMNRVSRCSWWTSSDLWGRWWEVSVLCPLNSLMSRCLKLSLLTCCFLSLCLSVCPPVPLIAVNSVCIVVLLLFGWKGARWRSWDKPQDSSAGTRPSLQLTEHTRGHLISDKQLQNSHDHFSVEMYKELLNSWHVIWFWLKWLLGNQRFVQFSQTIE